VRIESLEGTFDGPLAVDDDAAHQATGEAPAGVQASSPDATPSGKPGARRRTATKKNPR
jgi:hypothetical protein